MGQIIEELDLSQEELQLIMRALETHDRRLRKILGETYDQPHVMVGVGHEIDDTFRVRKLIYGVESRMLEGQYLRGEVVAEGDTAPKVEHPKYYVARGEIENLEPVMSWDERLDTGEFNPAAEEAAERELE